MSKFEIYKRVFPGLGPIIFRNFFLLVNGVIFSVVVLLFVFGNAQAGLFLGIVFVLNTFISIAQDIHARVLLEKLQMLTALKVIRINQDKTETLVLAEEIKKGDLLKLKLGDQVPCEGILISAENLEISEALITGESDTFPKKDGNKIIAGAIVTSGSAVMKSEGLFRESILAKISGDVKKYSTSPSSIQTSVNTVIKYSGYILLIVLSFVVTRGILVHASRLEVVTNAGALASTLVPQGLVVVITLLFAVGAANYSRRNVLFQEINATEKLGRIKNLCIDKTGTLTDNILLVEDMHIVEGLNEMDMCSLVYTSIVGLNDSSQTILAVKKYLEDNKKDCKEKEIVNVLPFSSWRRYSAVEMREGDISQTIFIGTPDIIIPRIKNVEEKKWLENLLGENARMGKRVLCVARANKVGLPKDLKNVDLSAMVIFVFHNTLRQGIKEAIKFFQERGVKIRVLSGDNLDTVRTIAESVGINGTENAVSGEQLEKWNDSDFEKEAHKYAVFAQILPEHKVKLIEAFKKDGFTAMVGDGVNDALAMKKSDLGIAMFDGVPVTRQLADVILMTNSFSDLPGAVVLADHFIRSIEINAGTYINQSLMGLFFFIIISIFGYSYPLTPLNITFINYFTVGFSGMLIIYWALRPLGKISFTSDKPFLKRVMPLVFCCAIIQALGTAFIFILNKHYLKTIPPNIIVGFSFILFGFLFLIFAINVYSGSLFKKEKFQIFLLAVFQIILIYLMLQIPFLLKFFNIIPPFPPFIFVGQALLVILIFGCIEYLIVKKLFFKS
jgi:cation-transporting ATPase E